MHLLKVRTWTTSQRDRVSTAFQTMAVGVFLALFREFSWEMVAMCIGGFFVFILMSWYVASFTRDEKDDGPQPGIITPGR